MTEGEARTLKGLALPKDDMPSIVLVDARNFHYALKRRGWQVDWARFREFCEREFGACLYYYYEGMITQQFHFDYHPGDWDGLKEARKAKRKFFRFLGHVGFTVRHKEIHRVHDFTTGKIVHKCNFDVEMAMDAMENLPDVKQIVLCSGDGDFLRLVNYFKACGRRAIVIADGEHLNWGMKKAANKLYFLEDLVAELKRGA